MFFVSSVQLEKELANWLENFLIFHFVSVFSFAKFDIPTSNILLNIGSPSSVQAHNRRASRITSLCHLGYHIFITTKTLPTARNGAVAPDNIGTFWQILHRH